MQIPTKMKRVLFLLMLASAFITSCDKDEVTNDPQTGTKPDELSVTGEVSGTWAKNSIVTVKGDIVVPAGKSLIIQEGVTVVMDTVAKPEFIVHGNLYSVGTKEKPVKFTVIEAARTGKYNFGRLWGGILASKTCAELLLDNTILEYGGATTTEASTSVKQGLYKAASGERVPALWFSNVSGKLVVQNSTIRHFGEDATYIEGGSVIFANNIFHTTGESGGDAINLKSGVNADVAYNLVYNANTNGLKLSNVGERTPQLFIVGYNNTFVNNGWRRPSVKGGSIWVEASANVELHNNLLVNCRFGIKRDTKKPEDNRSVFTNTYYYGFYQDGVNQFQPSSEIIAGTSDVISKTAGDNDPKFVNYPVSTAKDSNFDSNWDFRLQTGSPVLGKGITNFKRNFANGLTLNGQLYKSPEPSTYSGAFNVK